MEGPGWIKNTNLERPMDP
jgi:hypothetical protein